MTPTVDTLVPEQLWQAIQPLLPHPHAATAADPASTTAPRWPGSSTSCPPVSSAAAARSPAGGGCVTGAEVWQRLRHALLDQLGREGRLDWSRASLDSISVRAKRGAS
jgi:hypothetical protein